MDKPMNHSLDRPIWQALRSRHAQYAEGGRLALRYPADISPFAAAADDSAAALRELADIIPANGNVLRAEATEAPLPPGTEVVLKTEGMQMIGRSVKPPAEAEMEQVLNLTEADAPEILALATRTKPGPFLARTHLLGNFVGIRIAGKLVAMAGERLKLTGFTEVSGVCTDAEFRGRGFAGLLSRVVAGRIAARGEMPFLHAYAANTSAIRLYEQLGFEQRAMMSVMLLRRAP